MSRRVSGRTASDWSLAIGAECLRNFFGLVAAGFCVVVLFGRLAVLAVRMWWGGDDGMA